MEKAFLFNMTFHELSKEFWEVYKYIRKAGLYGKIYHKNYTFISRVVDIDKSKTVTRMGGLNNWIINHPTPTYTQPEQHKKIYLNIAKQYK